MNENEETVLSIITGQAGDPVEETPVYPSSEYIEFKGWNQDIPKVFPDKDMKFYPIIGNNSSITFKAAPGKFQDSEKTDLIYIGAVGSQTNLIDNPPPNPTRTGYEFMNWNPMILPSTFPENNIEIKSNWVPNVYRLTFDYNGGNILGETSHTVPIEYDGQYPLAPNPDKSYSIDFVSAETGETIVKTDTFKCSLNGYWSSTLAIGTQYYNGNRSPLISSYAFDSNLTIYAGWTNPRAPASGDFTNPYSKTGYDFNGWYESRDWTTKRSNYQSLNENKKLYAKWSPSQYTISFDYNGGKIGSTTSSILTVSYDAAWPTAPRITTPRSYDVRFITAATGNAIARTETYNCKFGGYRTAGFTWYLYNESYVPSSDKYNIAQNVTGFADWTGPRAPAEGNFDSPTRDGYLFEGWFEDRTWTTRKYNYSSLDGNKTLYAKWGPRTYQLTFNYNGGKIESATSSSANVIYDGQYPTAPSITTVPQYTVSFVSALSGSTVATTSAFNRSFNGYWSTSSASGTQYYNSSHLPAQSAYTTPGNLTIYAGWGTAGRTPASGNFAYTPSLAGYRFDGWHENGATSVVNYYSSLGSNKTLYAKWTPSSYTINFNYNGGKIGSATSSASSVTYKAAFPAAPRITTAPQYTVSFVSATTGSGVATTSSTARSFGGYFSTNAASGGTKYYNADYSVTASSYNYTSGINAYARWGNNAARIPASGSFAYTPSRSGCTFAGWYDGRTSSSTKVTYYNANALNGNKTLYSHWSQWKHTSANITATKASGIKLEFSKTRISTGTGDSTITTYLTVPTAALAAVPAYLKLSQINLELSAFTQNNKESKTTVSFNGKSQYVSVSEHMTGTSAAKTLSGFTGTYRNNSALSVKVSFYLHGGSNYHIGSFYAKLKSLVYST